MKKIFALVLLFVFSVSAFAHEYWFEADNFFLAKGEKTAIHLYVGEGLKQDEEKVYQKSKTEMFWLFSNRNNENLKEFVKDESLPMYQVSLATPGNYLLALERNWSYLKLGAKEFEDYLREDGLDYIISERARLGESQKEGRERYSRFIKTLLQVGDKRDAIFKKNAGLKLEIVPLENPYSKKIGDNLKFQILFDGKPLRDKTLFADNKDGAEVSKQQYKTDKNGKVSIKIDKKGVWLVRLVYMQRCAKDCAEADWESFWSAFSFGMK